MASQASGLVRISTNDTSYSDLVLLSGSGSMVYVSGQLAFDENRQIVGDTLSDQAGICFDRIEALLAQVGGDLNNVVRITTYLTDLEAYPDFDNVRAARFGESRPASTAVGVASLLFGALVEIEAIALLPASDHREEPGSTPSTHS